MQQSQYAVWLAQALNAQHYAIEHQQQEHRISSNATAAAAAAMQNGQQQQHFLQCGSPQEDQGSAPPLNTVTFAPTVTPESAQSEIDAAKVQATAARPTTRNTNARWRRTLGEAKDANEGTGSGVVDD